MLFVEKEGFAPLLEHVQLADALRHRDHVEQGHVRYGVPRVGRPEVSENKVPMLVLHDFDKAGFSILGTLRRNTRRYTFRNGAPAAVIDLGLRLADIDGLESEATFDRGSKSARRENLKANGATDEEIEFLLARRVELNALPSDRLVGFIEQKLNEHGVRKIVPDAETIAREYRLQLRGKQIAAVVEKMMQEEVGDIDVPADLNEKIAARLKKHPGESWDEAVRAIANGAADRDEPPAGARSRLGLM